MARDSRWPSARRVVIIAISIVSIIPYSWFSSSRMLRSLRSHLLHQLVVDAEDQKGRRPLADEDAGVAVGPHPERFRRRPPPKRRPPEKNGRQPRGLLPHFFCQPTLPV